MHLTSRHHGFLRYLTEWQAAEIYRRRRLCLRATRKAAAVSDSAIARKFELDRSTVVRLIARPGTGGADGDLIRAMVEGRDGLRAEAKRHSLAALAAEYGVPISQVLAAAQPEIWAAAPNTAAYTEPSHPPLNHPAGHGGIARYP